MISPFPKAPARKVENRGRKSGKTRILTDTPEKLEIEKAKEKQYLKENKKNPLREKYCMKVQAKLR